MDLKEVLHNVIEWAREVGKMQLEKIDKEIEYSSKSTDVDMVTEVDLLSEKIIMDKIKQHYPEHSILSEENGELNKESDYVWVVDPLDGTNNYLHRIPIFCISIALKHLGETILGVVYVPKLQEMFYSIKGEGAYLNDKSIRVGNKNALNECILATGFPYDKKISEHNNVNLFCNIVKDLQGIRRTGTAAFDLCSVACGRFDGYWELKLSLWDMAAGELIVKEAGGEVITSKINKEDGTKGINIIAGNEKVVSLVKERINEKHMYFN